MMRASIKNSDTQRRLKSIWARETEVPREKGNIRFIPDEGGLLVSTNLVLYIPLVHSPCTFPLSTAAENPRQERLCTIPTFLPHRAINYHIGKGQTQLG